MVLYSRKCKDYVFILHNEKMGVADKMLFYWDSKRGCFLNLSTSMVYALVGGGCGGQWWYCSLLLSHWYTKSLFKTQANFWTSVVLCTARPCLFVLSHCEFSLSFTFLWYILRFSFLPQLLTRYWIFAHQQSSVSIPQIFYSNFLVLSTFNSSLIARFMGQHGAHLGATGPKWAPCWRHEPRSGF